MVRNTPLTKFEQVLSCLHLFKSGALVSEIAMHWGVPFWQMGRYIKVWSKRWEEVAKDHVLLDPCPETFKWLQPVGYTVSYNTHINTYTHTICMHTTCTFTRRTVTLFPWHAKWMGLV